MKLVSVIIPTYKGYSQLSRAIESINSQTYKNIEIIVVDDNGDETEEQKKTENIINSIDKPFPLYYIKHHQNRNGACARNTGIAASQGDYICFLDDDDYYFSEKIIKCVDKLQERKDYNGVYSSVGTIKNGNIKILTEAKKEGNLYRQLLLDECFLGTGSNIFLTRKAIDVLKGFDERFKRNQDLEFMLRYFQHFKIAKIPDILVIKGNNGTYNIPPYEKMLECKQLLRKKFKNEINSLGNDIKKFEENEALSLYAAALFSKSGQIKIKQRKRLEQYRKLNIKEKIIFWIAMCNMYEKYVAMRNK